MPPRKRARPAQTAAQRAMWANMTMARKYPYSQYGRQYIPRGHFLAQAGSSYARATPEQRAWRRANNYHGVGMYTGNGMYTGYGGFWKSLGRGLRKLGKSKLVRGIRHDLAKEAGVLADEYMPGAGAAAQQALKAAGIGMYTGSGSYKAVKNDLIEGGHASEGVMRFDVQDDQDAIVISHSEYVMDVYAPADGVRQSDTKLPLNVGESTTFPMLSQIAANFEDYQIVQLAFTYKPTLSDWQTTTGQVGQILMATNYNPNAQMWTTKQQMLAQTGSTSARTIDATLHGIECDPSKMHNDGHYLVRTGPPRLDTNLTDFDHGWTQLTVVDMPAGTGNKTLGELHVSYTIKLSKPRIWSGVANGVPRTLALKTDSQDWNLQDTVNITSLGDSFQLHLSVPTDLYAEDMLKARQGNIPFKFDRGVFQGEFGGHDWARVTLPAQFTGDVKISVSVHYKLIWIEGQSARKDPALIAFNTQGQIDSIDDSVMMIGGHTSETVSPNVRNVLVGMNPSHGLTAVGAHTGPGTPAVRSLPICIDARDAPQSGELVDGIVRAEGHFRVGVARDLLDNMFVFCLGTPQSGYQQNVTVEGCCVEIEAYNTTLNYRQDGTNDKVILVDKAQQVVTY